MEIGNVIIGSRLSQIQKKPGEVKLVFENAKVDETYTLTFGGLLFETAGSALNKRVKNVQLNETLGFRALTQLRYLRENPENYRQLFIQIDGSNDENKFELVCAVRAIKLSRRHRMPAKGRTGVGTEKSAQADQ